MELGHPDIMCPCVCFCVCVCHLFQGTTCALTACFVGDSLCATVFVGVLVWTKCLWLGGLRAVVDNLLLFIDVHLRAGMPLLLQT